MEGLRLLFTMSGSVWYGTEKGKRKTGKRMQTDLQTVKTVIRLLKQQSDLAINCLQRHVCLKFYDHFMI